MAKEKNPDKVRMSTPRCVLKWPKLTKVDTGTAKFPDPDGSYNTKAILDRSAPRVGTYLDKLDQMMERAKELAEEKFAELPIKARKTLEAKNPATGGIVADSPYSPVYDEDTEEDTGKVELRFKMKASGVRKDKSKWSAKPDLFDGKGKPLPKGIEIWGGSTAIIVADYEPYFVAGTGSYGIQRRLVAVQVVDLVTSGGQRSASSYGFEEQEDGFDSSDIEVADETDSDDAGSGETSADDDDTDF